MYKFSCLLLNGLSGVGESSCVSILYHIENPHSAVRNTRNQYDKINKISGAQLHVLYKTMCKLGQGEVVD